MYITPGICGGDPDTLAAGHGGAPVQACGKFAANIGHAAAHAFFESGVQCASHLLHQARSNLDASRPQPPQSAATDDGVRVFHRDHNPRNAGFQQGIGAGWRASMMAAGFQRDKGGGTTRRISSQIDGITLGMGLAGAAMKALPYH